VIIERFKQQADRRPDKLAVKDEKGSLTYRELDRFSNLIAGKIRALCGPGRAVNIGMLLDDSIPTIAAMLGILKSGNAYVPLVMDFPVKRIEYIIRHAEIEILITDYACKERVSSVSGNKNLRLIIPGELESSGDEPDFPGGIYRDTDAYLLYTSGSTGFPKGVRQTHQNVLYFIDRYSENLGIRSTDNLTSFASFSHDVSTMDIYSALFNGATLFPLDLKQEGIFMKLSQWLAKEKITVWHSVPTVFRYFVSGLTANDKLYLPSLRRIVLGGEGVVPGDIEKFYSLFRDCPGCSLYTLYGQTESSYNSGQFFPIDRRHGGGEITITLGGVNKGTRMVVVDEEGFEADVLEPGEIMVVNPHISPGYWKDETGTAEKFTQFPADDNGVVERVHFSGDLGRRLADGRIEFLGRKDNQVKIRGFRVELEEIERVVMQYPDISEAGVIVLDIPAQVPGLQEKFLACYFAARRNIDIKDLQEFLRLRLMDYMIPAYFKQLEKLPVTSSGKIARKALPVPEIMPGQNVPPAGSVEKKLVEIWSGVLNLDKERIGMESNFFELGGHSLRAILLTTRIHSELDVRVPLAEIFERKTLKDLAEYIRQAGQSRYIEIKPVEKKEFYALSSAQKRLYFLQQMELTGTAYNMPMVLPMGKDMDIKRIETALKGLIARHESLRTSFIMVEDEPVQRISEENYKLQITNYKQNTNSKFQITNIKDFVRPFDLSQAPLIHSGIIDLPDGNRLWMVDIHHIISDGTSHTILMDDFAVLYDGGELGPLQIRYKDFSEWQNRLFAGGVIKSQENYWLDLYPDAGEIPRVDLAVDYKRPDVFTFSGDHYNFKLERDDALAFKTLGSHYGATLYMNILAVLNTLFYRYTGQTDIIIGTGISGRPHAGLQAIMGMFVNTLAIRNYPDGEKTYEFFLKEVMANSIKAFENQDLQFEELVDKLDLPRDPSRNPLFDVSLVVQNFSRVNERLVAGDVEVEGDDNLYFPGYRNPTSKLDLTFFVYEIGDEIHFTIEYYTGIFKSATIRCLVVHFKNIIKTVLNAPAITLKDIDIISEEEKKRILYEFNDTARDYPRHKNIHQLFEEEVESNPDRIALVGPFLKEAPFGQILKEEAVYLTYRKVNEKANRLAHLYETKDIQPEEVVGIWMSQSVERPAAVLGVLKAGGVYVPIDPSLPLERIKFMIHDASINIVISEKKFIRDLNRLQWECESFHTYLCVDSFDIHGEDEIEQNELMAEELWHHVAETAVDDITAGGWISSYTGKPFSREEMAEYGNNILKKLEPLLQPCMRVLEIGCASGISMYRIAPRIGLYYGTDLSSVIIDWNRKKVKEERHQNIQLSCLAAHEVFQIMERDFDLVIMNSVIQCFHGHNYLRKVVRQCIDLLGETGYLFIGDVMDLERKEELVRELTAFTNANRDKGYTTRTDFSPELFLSRGFWLDLGEELKDIREIKFSDKIYTIENELTKFRYDVLITVDKERHNNKGYPERKFKYQEDLRWLQDCESSPVPVYSRTGTLAYIIYTSGTTAGPRGVMVEHRGICNLKTVFEKDFNIGTRDKIIQFSNISFDASVWEIFMALLTGAKLHLLAEEIIGDYGLFHDYLRKHCVTVATLPPSYAIHLNVEALSTLRLLVTAGSPANIDFVKRCEGRFEFINAYGPTEVSICSSYWRLEPGRDWDGVRIPIGKPLFNLHIYIVNEMMLFQPIGVAGELCVSGDGLARGYLNNPELTSERFGFYRSYKTYRTYSSYRTGDLARWLADGNIEFLGRIDHQVKIRGFRIEPGEIEARLLKHNLIKEAVVIDRLEGSGEKYLCGYIVCREPFELSGLSNYLAKNLPAYMVPAYFVNIDKIPLTRSGKVDRKALPVPELIAREEYAAPCSEAEKKLVEIWSEVLGVQASVIGLDDNFFQLGGHSIKAFILALKINHVFHIYLPLVEVFKRSCIRRLAEFIAATSKQDSLLSIKDDNLVVLRKGSGTGEERNLFLVHGGSGEVEGYIGFCGHLDVEWNCWGLRADRLDNYTPQNLRIESVARKYIEKIKKVQPQGPYCIGGWSIGGTIAFEMVRQLEEVGEGIDFLALFDTAAPDPEQIKPTGEITLASEMKWVLDYLPAGEITEKVKGVSDLYRLWPLIVDSLEENPFEAEKLRKSIPSVMARAIPGFEHQGIGGLIFYINIIRSFDRARSCYVPAGKIKTRIHFFAAGENRRSNWKNWNNYTEQPLSFYQVKGDHFSMFEEGHILSLARKFKR
jgi:amino acid adenylation domain-containing protein